MTTPEHPGRALNRRNARGRRCRGYFVGLPLGLVVAPLGDGLLGGVDVAGGAGGTVVDGGDADGERSPGRSPTRSVGDSLQAVSMPTLSAKAHSPVSILFIGEPPPCGVARLRRAATPMPAPSS